MFGYVKTDFPNLYVKDTVLYKAMYCGLCKAIGKISGTRGRFVLNYDLAFLSVFLHNIIGEDVEVKKERCIIHRVKKRPIAGVDELTERIAALNVILAEYKITDDIEDNNKGRIKGLFIKKAYKRAKRKEPVLDKIVKEEYANLRNFEKINSDSADMVADSFGNLMQRVVSELIGDKNTEEIATLSYNLGKWIYLIDAVDDFDKDKKHGNFNVFINAYKEISTKEDLIKEKTGDLITIFGATLNIIAESSRKIEYKFNHDLIDNVFLRGLGQQTKTILENKKCKSTTKF